MKHGARSPRPTESPTRRTYFEAWFEEEVKYQEMRKKYLEDENKEENKRKRQASTGKKTGKKKSKSKKKELQNEIPGQKKTASPLRKEICEKLDHLFVEVGLERKNHRIYEVEGDGACACNCVGVHCHGDQKLGKYVRRNTGAIRCFWSHVSRKTKQAIELSAVVDPVSGVLKCDPEEVRTEVGKHLCSTFQGSYDPVDEEAMENPQVFQSQHSQEHSYGVNLRPALKKVNDSGSLEDDPAGWMDR